MTDDPHAGPAPGTDAFQRAIAERGDRWYAACLRITRDAALAEDAVQDALLTAWRRRETFAGDARLETWIHSIAVNAALDLLRRRRPGAFVPLAAEPEDHGDGPEALAQRQQTDALLGHSLRGLTDMERVCFVLRHVEQWRIREIAIDLAISESSVKQAIFRGVAKLRRALGDPERIRHGGASS